MILFNKKIKHSFVKKEVIKIISGINNFNINDIVQYVKACEVSNATYIDIAADPAIVSFIKKISNIPICVSSININALYNSVLAGADIVEIGNFDIFYNQGIVVSSHEIINMSSHLRSIFPFIDICVTIPYWLNLDQQIKLAIHLESIGVNIIQTEGSYKDIDLKLSNSSIKNNNLYNCLFKASSSLSSLYVLSKYTNLPIIAASGLNAINASIALSYGASGIGIKSSISQLSTIMNRSSYINEIKYSLKFLKIVNKSYDLYCCHYNTNKKMFFYNV